MSDKKFTLSITDPNFKHTSETKAWLRQTEEAIHNHMKDMYAAVEDAITEAYSDCMVYGIEMATVKHLEDGTIIVENSRRKWEIKRG